MKGSALIVNVLTSSTQGLKILIYIGIHSYYTCSVIVQHMEEFKHQEKLVPPHISCKYGKEMSTKSEVVSRFAQFHIYYICENMHYMTLCSTIRCHLEC